MSTANRINHFIQIYKSFREQNPERIFEVLPIHTDYDGPNPEECRENLKFIIQVIDTTIKEESLAMLPWHTYNSMVGIAQNAYNSLAAYQTSRDQGSFQNFALQLDSFAYHLRMFGFADLAMGKAKIEQAKFIIDRELDRLLSGNSDLELLKNEVKRLIAPAVAGSLSEAFTSRRNSLLKGRQIWASVAAAGGIASIYFTYNFVTQLSDAIMHSDKLMQTGFSWSIALIRSIVLLPVYAAFGFSFSQYKKERDFEEEYAHKAAVATSLPNYGDLARESSVRDQIVTGATNVIFTSPTAQSKELSKAEAPIEKLKELIESISKLIPKRD